MNKNIIIPVILCGGSGSRLWPLSRQSFPKQYLSIMKNTEKSLLQNTQERLEGIKNISNPIVICNEEQRFVAAEQLREININPRNIFLEPCGRNTAPAITIAVLKALEEEKDPFLLVLAADHVIKNKKRFQLVIEKGIKFANQERIVTFGIVPTHAETGFGYIEGFSKFNLEDCDGIPIKRFIEKPQLKDAKKFVKDHHFLWNSGMFLFKANTMLKELLKFNKKTVELCKDSLLKSKKDFDFIRLDKNSFEGCPEVSIDVGVMEKTKLGTVLPLKVGWNDIGSWTSLWNFEEKDSDNNVVLGNVINRNSRNCYLRSEERLVVGIGLKDLIVVETNDATLICNNKNDQEVKDLVNYLKKERLEEGKNHKLVYRPWGSFISLAEDVNWKVKRIEIKKGASISLQLHQKRSEHWVVVKGQAIAQIEDKKFNLIENQSIFIPMGSKHRLTNSGINKLVIIEIQTGEYLGEDDIFRFEDNYGRH